MAERIQLRRAKGWRLPENAVNCARPSPLGNPFIVGQDGDRAYCVKLHRILLDGYICLSCKAAPEVQRAHRRYVFDHLDDLRGKDLACWCRLDGKPCHVDTLLELANA